MNGVQVGGGRTAGPLQDMNDALSFLLEKGHTYTFAYENSRGEKTTVEVLVGNDPMTVKGYMQKSDNRLNLPELKKRLSRKSEGIVVLYI